MAVSLLPTAALAEGAAWDGTADTSWYTEHAGESSFILTSAEQLAGLEELVNGGNDFTARPSRWGRHCSQ